MSDISIKDEMKFLLERQTSYEDVKNQGFLLCFDNIIMVLVEMKERYLIEINEDSKREFVNEMNRKRMEYASLFCVPYKVNNED